MPVDAFDGTGDRESFVFTPGMVLAIECFLGGKTGVGAGFDHIVHVGDGDVDILTASAASRPWSEG